MALIFIDASAMAALTALTWLSVASPMTFLIARVTAASIVVAVLVIVDHDQARTADGDGLLGLRLEGAFDLALCDLPGASPDDRADRGRDEERRREEPDDEPGPAEAIAPSLTMWSCCSISIVPSRPLLTTTSPSSGAPHAWTASKSSCAASLDR